MFYSTYRLTARSLLTIFNVRVSTHYIERFPHNFPVILVSNHRSFLDAAILVSSVPKSLRIACHYYMGKTPILREIVSWLGCFPLAEPQHRQRKFFQQATELLTNEQWIGIFPEGTEPMLSKTNPRQVGEFYRGFAHLALRVPVANLAIVPVAIASVEETVLPTFPIRWLRLFDASESLFDCDGLHPLVFYHQVKLLVGNPYFVTRQPREQYQGKQAKQIVTNLSNYCREEISSLLRLDREGWR